MPRYKKHATMTVEEAGKRGGDKTIAKHGHEHYVKIGKIGGAANVAMGRDFAALGHVGGSALRDQRGSAFFAEIGRKGGTKNKEKGRAYFQEIGRKGGRAPRVSTKKPDADAPLTLEN